MWSTLATIYTETKTVGYNARIAFWNTGFWESPHQKLLGISNKTILKVPEHWMYLWPHQKFIHFIELSSLTLNEAVVW